jgi:hypothetical protein
MGRVGVGCVDQTWPSQRAANGIDARRVESVPVAKQLMDDGHDTESSPTPRNT